jgi:hypothetical protein
MKVDIESFGKFINADPLEIRLWKETGEYFAGKREPIFVFQK